MDGSHLGSPDLLPTLHSLGHAVITTDVHGVVTFWSRAAEQMYGWTAAEATGRPIHELTVPVTMQDFADDIMRALKEGRSWSGAFTVRHKDGSTFPALVTDTGLCDDSGQVVGVVGVSVSLVDVIATFLRRSHEALVVIDAVGVIRMCSPVLSTLTGWSVESLTGHNWWHLVHPDDVARARAADAEAVAGRDMVPPIEHRLRCPDGSWLWVETAETSLLDEPAVRGVLLTLRDISQRRAWVDELTRRAVLDELTGLVNRAVFMEHLQTHVAGRHHVGAVFYVDLDEFKEVNDRLGHVAGDQVLREVADRLGAAVRPEDVCGRLGGDEFAVLAPNLVGSRQAFALARRIHTAIGGAMTVDDTLVRPTASVGVVVLSETDSADHAISLADKTMYVRKRRRATAARRRAAADAVTPPARLPRQRKRETVGVQQPDGGGAATA